MKRFLLLAYYFPPCGGAGVQRWLRLLPYLQDAGWLPTVITTADGDYPVSDDTLCSKVPPNVKVIRTKTPSMSFLYSKLSKDKGGLPHGSLQYQESSSPLRKILFWLRINLIAPDVRRVWNSYAYRAAVTELRTNKYELLVTTGPPHSTHLVGLKLKKRFGVKWVSDFRDPWKDINYLQVVKQNRIIRYLNAKMEKETVATADLNLIISHTISDSLPHGKKTVLYNGYDPQDFPTATASPPDDITPGTLRPLRIKYVGAIRKGYPLQEVLQWLAEIPVSQLGREIELTFVGSFRDEQAPSEPGINIINIEHSSHQDAVKEMLNADLLLLLIRQIPDNKGILTTKLFEYIAAGNFIIGVGPADGEAAKILRDSGTGLMVDYRQKEEFIAAIIECSRKLAQGKPQPPDNKRIEAYSAPHQAKTLAALFEELSTPKPTPNESK